MGFLSASTTLATDQDYETDYLYHANQFLPTPWTSLSCLEVEFIGPSHQYPVYPYQHYSDQYKYYSRRLWNLELL